MRALRATVIFIDFRLSYNLSEDSRQRLQLDAYRQVYRHSFLLNTVNYELFKRLYRILTQAVEVNKHLLPYRAGDSSKFTSQMLEYYKQRLATRSS